MNKLIDRVENIIFLPIEPEDNMTFLLRPAIGKYFEGLYKISPRRGVSNREHHPHRSGNLGCDPLRRLSNIRVGGSAVS
ncbi:hypothetical protein D3OALGA1CA_5026 [Olavius algarvensis associated proteobacterium Delta 3]|nr:hypothetical protein D3OALGA1CA_5026 [Olavius algarvensis associated proteobacterium Delta 3]